MDFTGSDLYTRKISKVVFRFKAGRRLQIKYDYEDSSKWKDANIV